MKLNRKIMGVLTAAVCAVSSTVSGGFLTLITEASYSPETSYGDYLYYQQVDEDNDGTYDYIKITDCDESAAEIEIPSEIDGLSVTVIGEYAFGWCSSLISIAIPDSVTTIESNAFSYCKKLTDITLPEGITSIEFGTFNNCSCLTGITLPKSVTSIGNIAFSDCDSLNNVIIPEGVVSIGESAFNDCSALTDITIPDSVISIGGYAFDCTPWIKTKQQENPLVIVNGILISGETCTGDITIPDNVTSIGDSSFYNCSALTSVKMSDSVKSIGFAAFYNCYRLTSVAIPENVTSIGNSAFSNCDSLTDINIPESVTSIGNYTFEYCSSLTDINIPEGVTSIGVYAFSFCSSLTNITIPESVTSIGNCAFYGCKSLTGITIPDDVTTIGDCAFGYCAFKSIVIPDSVKSFGGYGGDMFDECPYLEKVVIGSSVRTIWVSTLGNCENLKEITIRNPECEIEDDENTINAAVTIYGYENSPAQEYAEKYNRTFIALDSEQPTETEPTSETDQPDETIDSSLVTKYGDLNNDDDVSISDVVKINLYLLNKTENPLDAVALANADCVRDGVINASDSSIIMNYTAMVVSYDKLGAL